MDNKELNLNEMEEIVGGRGGSRTMLPARKGFAVYRIQSGDCLSRIAGRYGVSAKYLQSINSTIAEEVPSRGLLCVHFPPSSLPSFCPVPGLSRVFRRLSCPAAAAGHSPHASEDLPRLPLILADAFKDGSKPALQQHVP